MELFWDLLLSVDLLVVMYHGQSGTMLNVTIS